MSATRRPSGWARRPATQAGATAVEFSIVVLLFLTFVFGVIELARVVYVFNTLQEVTRRAANGASKTKFSDTAAMNAVRYNAIFRTAAGFLALGQPVTDQHVRIDYLSLASDGTSMTMTPIPGGSMPSCPARNKKNCMTDPNGASCIRFVRARICDPANASACTPVHYQTITALIKLPLDLPVSTAIVPADTLGFVPGDSVCP